MLESFLPRALRFCGLAEARTLTISMPGPITSTSAATNDVLEVASDGSLFGGKLSMAWASAGLLAGSAPPDSGVWLNDSVPYPGHTAAGVTCKTVGETLALCTSPTPLGMPWGLGFGPNASAAVRMAETAACVGGSCSFSLGATIRARLKPYAEEPAAANGSFAPVMGKALSVMRVNALAPEGRIEQRWSTPDRMPHRWMWLWDSCYHSFAANLMPGDNNGHRLGWECES